MTNEIHIRKQIRKYLLENSQIGTGDEEELEYSPESIENMIALSNNRKADQEKRHSSMKKQYVIPQHPDKVINRMMKRTLKTKMDGIEDEIDSIDDQEEELDDMAGMMDKLHQQNQDYSDKFAQMSQTTSQVDIDSSVTNT
jgi:hypothetical protein